MEIEDKKEIMNLGVSNFFKKMVIFSEQNKKNKVLLFKQLNNLVDLLIDQCIKINIENIKKNYNTHSEFVLMFKEELINFLFLKIDINDDTYDKNMECFEIKKVQFNEKDNESYFTDYGINANDYGSLGSSKTNLSKLEKESEKIGAYIFIMKEQNKIELLNKKINNMCKEYISVL